MATLRELRDRIKSVNSTKKITKAQELIATSRITKAQARVAASLPYSDEITRVLSALASASSLEHPMLTERPNARRSAILVITSDRGMCGGYNHNVLKEAEELGAKLRDEGQEVVLYVMGTHGVSYYTFRDRAIDGQWTGFSQDPGYADSSVASYHLVDAFLAGSGKNIPAPDGHGTVEGFDELHLVYTRFVSMLAQVPTAHRIVPIETVVEEDEIALGEDMLAKPAEAVTAEYEFEPEADTLLAALLPKYVSTRIYAALLESSASESAARRTAMKAATDNATELANTLSREANQARQAQITQEISEIVGGAGALAASAGSD